MNRILLNVREAAAAQKIKVFSNEFIYLHYIEKEFQIDHNFRYHADDAANIHVFL